MHEETAVSFNDCDFYELILSKRNAKVILRGPCMTVDIIVLREWSSFLVNLGIKKPQMALGNDKPLFALR